MSGSEGAREALQQPAAAHEGRQLALPDQLAGLGSAHLVDHRRVGGDMEAVEHVQRLPGALGGEPLEEALKGLGLEFLADAQQPPTGVQLIHGGEARLADRPASSSTPSAGMPSKLIRARRLATAIPAVRCTVSQAVSKMQAVFCQVRRLANWPETDRRPLSSAACRRPTAGSRPSACRNAGRPRDAWRRPTWSAG